MKLLDALASRVDTRPEARTLVLVAHPDDEVVGAGSRLSRLRDAWFVYVTDGAPRSGYDAAKHGLDVDGYRERRREERAAALALCGIHRDRIVDLGCPDQHAALQLAALSRTLVGLIEAHRIDAILTQPYEGGHPDHDATAFIAHAAARFAHVCPQPSVVEMTSYHAGPQGIVWCEFIPHEAVDARKVTIALSPQQQRRKQGLLDCHASQRETLQACPLDVERFRPAPPYDFRLPPHEGTLWYDSRDWGMTGARFRELAARALLELGLVTR